METLKVLIMKTIIIFFQKDYSTNLKLSLIKKKKIRFKKKNKSLKLISTKKIVIGTGIVPPKKIEEIIINQNSNYIWDFYSTGGTKNLIKKINNILKYKKTINIVFIGNKAGLLETMQEIENLINKKKNKFEDNLYIQKCSITSKSTEIKKI